MASGLLMLQLCEGTTEFVWLDSTQGAHVSSPAHSLWNAALLQISFFFILCGWVKIRNVLEDGYILCSEIYIDAYKLSGLLPAL